MPNIYANDVKNVPGATRGIFLYSQKVSSWDKIINKRKGFRRGKENI